MSNPIKVYEIDNRAKCLWKLDNALQGDSTLILLPSQKYVIAYQSQIHTSELE